MAIVDLPANENARGQSVDIGEEKSPKDTPMAISIISKAAVFFYIKEATAMRAAFYYARVSSGPQENEETIQIQVAELCARMIGGS